ncbi:MAG: hypothetical protein WC514_00850 [Candidatus Paceibacterota bacterium]
MSDWNIKLRERKKVIIIKQILQRWPNCAGGLPAMKIIDQGGKEHFIVCLDAVCLVSEWEKIGVGSRIEVTLRESVVGVRVSLQKPVPKRIKEEENPQSPYYRWTCNICGETGIVSYGEWEEPLIIGKRIKSKHRAVSPSCNSLNLKIIDHYGIDKTEEFKQIVGVKSAKVVE